MMVNFNAYARHIIDTPSRRPMEKRGPMLNRHQNYSKNNGDALAGGEYIQGRKKQGSRLSLTRAGKNPL